MREKEVLIVNRLGLHMRAAAKLVSTAERFQSEIVLNTVSTPEKANAKSIFELLRLSAGKGDRMLISVDGIDEAAALEAVLQLFEDGFYED